MEESAKSNANIVILTGAGISAESGLSTFRDKDGIWSRYRIEDVATPDAFARQPEKVHEFYNMRRKLHLSDALAPNEAHKALARLEKEWKGSVLLVTQNVDHLHEQGGSEVLIHMHGEMAKIRCGSCESVMEWWDDLAVTTPCPHCGTRGSLRPHIVWFGEQPMRLKEIFEALSKADLFLSIGTSGTVYPAAGFVDIIRDAGKPNVQCISFNLEEETGAHRFDRTISGPATETVPTFVDQLLRSQND